MIETIPKLAEDIYAVHEAREATATARAYLGGSAIGRPCARSLWHDFRGANRKAFSGRMLRLFQTGHLEEPRMIEELTQAGYEIVAGMPNGRQFRVQAFGGHFAGHLDGLLRGIDPDPSAWHVVDFKTANTKSFDQMASKGIAEAKPEYYAQAQVYMGLAPQFWESWQVDGEPPKAAVYIVRCKDDERLYVERMAFDPDAFRELGGKARSIITAEAPPPRIAEKADYYVCKYFCDHRELCHAAQLPRIDCRTCVHSTPKMDGSWHCQRLDATLQDFVGCPSHLFLPPLVDRVLGAVKDYDRDHNVPHWISYTGGERNSDEGEESSWSIRKRLEAE
jgi:hypothetical protein